METTIIKLISKKDYPVCDTSLHRMVRLQMWISVEYGAPFHCHYSLVFSDSEWQYLFVSHLGVKWMF